MDTLEHTLEIGPRALGTPTCRAPVFPSSQIDLGGKESYRRVMRTAAPKYTSAAVANLAVAPWLRFDRIVVVKFATQKLWPVAKLKNSPITFVGWPRFQQTHGC